MDPNRSPRAYLTHKKEEIHMKRKLLSVLLVLAMALTLLPTAAFAEDATTLTPGQDGNITLTGNVSLADTYTVASGEVTLDLAGYTITAPQNKVGITVSYGAALTIKDSSTGGTIKRTGTENKYVVLNNGTLNLQSGTISSTATSSTTLANRSTTSGKAVMNISGGKVTADYIAVKNDCQDNGSTLPELNITGGSFEGAGKDQVIQNWGAASIEGGSFTGCVGTWTDGSAEIGQTTISGGTFDLPADGVNVLGVLALFQYNQSATGTQARPAKLVVSGDVDVTTKDSIPVVALGYYDASAGGNRLVESEIPENITMEVSAGTYSAEVDSRFLAEGKACTENNDGKFVVGDTPAPEKAALGFAVSDSNTEFYGKTAGAMGDFTVGTPTTDPNTGFITIPVTGSASYLSEYAGWQVDTEQEGHYLPLKITATPDSLAKITTYNRTVGAKEGKEIALTNGAEDVAFFLDGKETCDGLDDNTFKVVAGGKDDTGANVYVIDFSGVTLLPKPVVDEAAGTTTEVELKPAEGGKPAQVVTETKKGDAVIGSVALPADTKGLGGMSVEVKSVETNALPQAVQDSDTKVATALKDSETKLVQVTVKVTDELGNETEHFTGGSALQDAAIVITIGGLESGATYYVFSVNETTGAVTSYGYKTLEANETSIQINSKHLTILAAAKVAGASEDGLTAEDVLADNSVSKADEEDSGLTKSNGSTPTPGTATYTVAAAAGSVGNKVTVNGTSGKFYIIQVWNGTNLPAAIFCLPANAEGKVEFYANTPAAISIWEAADESAFDGKVPADGALTEVHPA